MYGIVKKMQVKDLYSNLNSCYAKLPFADYREVVSVRYKALTVRQGWNGEIFKASFLGSDWLQQIGISIYSRIALFLFNIQCPQI
jgi:hypothetical protein